MFTKIEDALNWMEQRRFTTKGIDEFKNYLSTLRSPQNKIPCIHVGGTNGKGSTVQYISHILQAAKYKIGTFTSPYLETHFDRIRINDKNIDEQWFLSIVNKYYTIWEKHQFNMFEIDFIIASLYFEKEKPDFVIYEVGLGGRKDATNVVNPIVSVITNIGMDHMEQLGYTYQEIAKEKAGIIKLKTPLVTSEQKPECLSIFQTTCEEKESECILIDQAQVNIRNFGIQFLYKDTFVDLKQTPIYQTGNICCALEVIYYLKRNNLAKVTTGQIRSGLESSSWQGRFEVMCLHPVIIIDGAHNLEGIEALCMSMQGHENIHIIFSALKDKDHDMMLKKLLQISDDITVCEFDSYRSTTCEELAKQFPVHRVPDYRFAIDQAFHKSGIILITGSLYFISAVRKYVLDKRKSEFI